MILKPNVAGIFYPSDKKDLLDMLKSLKERVDIKEIKDKIEDVRDIKALIAPHAGYIYSGLVAMYGYLTLKKIKLNLKTVLLWGPTHYYYFSGAYQPETYKYWETPLGKLAIEKYPSIPANDAVFYREHSLEVHLPFIQFFYDNPKIKPLLFGNPYSLDDINLKEDEVIIVSSDLSHYLPYDDAVKRDNETLQMIVNKDERRFLQQGDACGKYAILSLLSIANKREWKVKVIKYNNSGDVIEDKSSVVGYSSVIFYEQK